MKFFKFLSTLAFLAAAGSLAGTWVVYQRYDAERAARTALESRQVQLEEENSFLETQAARMPQYEQELERLRTQVKGGAAERGTLKKELDGAYGQISALKKQIQNLEAEKQTLNNQLNIGQAAESAIVREAAKLVPPPPKPEEKPSPKTDKSAKEEKKKAETKAETKKETPSKEKTPEKEKTAKKEEPPPRVDPRPLQVLSVNRQFKFVVVNLGLRENIKVGDTLRVEQGGKLIGRLQVEKLYENFSACNIIEEIKPAQIREGDLVRIA